VSFIIFSILQLENDMLYLLFLYYSKNAHNTVALLVSQIYQI